jgi:hypothetical protein
VAILVLNVSFSNVYVMIQYNFFVQAIHVMKGGWRINYVFREQMFLEGGLYLYTIHTEVDSMWVKCYYSEIEVEWEEIMCII